MALLAVSTAARAVAPEPAAARNAVLADPSHLLTARQRMALERLLRAKTIESGSVLSILLVPHLTRHETIEELAQRAFAADSAARAEPTAPAERARVLLVVSTRERRAAIETGQGPAGIVPEIDARSIIQRLAGALAHHELDNVLEEAVGAIAASARATAERRRPLPPEPVEVRPAALPVPPADQAEPGPDEGEPRPQPDGAPPPAAPSAQKPGGRRSLMPGAYVLAAFVVIGLAIRRRRRVTEDRVTPPPGPAGPRPKQDRDLKSIGDRPRS